VEGPVADLGSGGAVEDVGTPPLLSWSRGTRPVPEDVVSTMMESRDQADVPFSEGTDVEASTANHGPRGAVEDGRRMRTMWPAMA
jgi:hypothetical protein